MKSKIFAALLCPLLALIAGCSNPPAPKEIFDQEDPAQITAESSPGAKFKIRALASVDEAITASADPTKLETDFQKLMSSRDLNQFQLRLQLKLDAIEEIYLRAHGHLQTFDQTLDTALAEKNGDIDQFFDRILKSGLYPKILSLRESQVSRQHQLAYFFKRFQEISTDSNSDPEAVKRAQNAIRYTGQYYRTLPMHYLIAHYQLGLELEQLNLKSLEMRKGLNRMLHGMRKREDSTAELIDSYREKYTSPEITLKMNEASEALRSMTTPLSGQLNESAKALQSTLFSAREAFKALQSDPIAPGTGPSGNITGNGFPAGVWSITFDDGPHGTFTQKVLENLHANGMKATFFMLAQSATLYPKIALQVRDAGHEFANHSWSHPQLTKISATRLEHEIKDSTDRLTEILGSRPKLFRCPYGAGTSVARIRSLIAREKMVHVFWNVDSLDWQDHNPNSILARVKKEMALSKKGGGVILFHDIHPQSVEASRMLMEHFNERNKEKPGSVQIMPVSDVVQMLNTGG